MSKSTSIKMELSLKQRDELLAALQARFDANMGRHPGLVWAKVPARLRTPPEIRELGGAIYGDRRYNRVFIGHNGAESYYGGRGFRGSVRV
jgi:hypothetical protein